MHEYLHPKERVNPVKGRGHPPKLLSLPGLWLLGRRRISGGLSHFRGVLSFWVYLAFAAYFRECGVSPDSRFFIAGRSYILTMERLQKRKEREK